MIKSVKIVFDSAANGDSFPEKVCDRTVAEGVQTFTHNLLEILIGDTFVLIKNKGRAQYAGVIGSPVYFKSIDVTCSGLAQSAHPFDGSVCSPSGSVDTIVSYSGYIHSIPTYFKSHYIDGSEIFMAQVVRSKYVVKPIDGLATLNCLSIVNLFDDHHISALLDLYSFKPNSFGVRLIPSVFAGKWTSVDVQSVSGWYGSSDIQSAGEGFTNCHYGHDAWFILSSLRGSCDPFVGFNLLLHKICYGLYRPSSSWFGGMWRYEKGVYPGTSNPSRRGYGSAPSRAKEYDLGLLMGYIAFAKEPLWFLIAEAVNIRRDNLLTTLPSNVWNGGGGARQLGHYLNNLYDFMTFDQLAVGTSSVPRATYLAKARAVIDHAIKVNGSLDLFKNSGNPRVSLWEEVSALTMILKWCREGAQFAQDWTVQREFAKRLALNYIKTATSIVKHRGDELQYTSYDYNTVTGVLGPGTYPLHAVWYIGLYTELALNGVSFIEHHGKSAADMAKMCFLSAFKYFGMMWTDVMNLSRPLPMLNGSLGVDNGNYYGSSAEKQFGIALTALRMARV